MQYKCKIEVIDKKNYTDYQQEYLINPNVGPCTFYEIGDTVILERYDGADNFMDYGQGKICAEAWDCMSRYVYTALQGGAIMRGWSKDERQLLACCNDATRPVIFNITRLDYKVVKIDGMGCAKCVEKAKAALEAVPKVDSVDVRLDKGWAEVFCNQADAPSDEELTKAAEAAGFTVTGID